MNTALLVSIFALCIALASLFLFFFLSFGKIKTVDAKLEKLFCGKDAASLEDAILTNATEIKALDREIQQLFEISNKLHQLSLKSIHKFEVVRFNPFKDIGGDQSFAIALLDGKNSGLVISSLHTREGTRIYAKPVTKGESEKYSLTEEEKNAIKQAMTIKPTKM